MPESHSSMKKCVEKNAHCVIWSCFFFIGASGLYVSLWAK